MPAHNGADAPLKPRSVAHAPMTAIHGRDFTLAECMLNVDFWLLFFSFLISTGAGVMVINNVTQIYQSLAAPGRESGGGALAEAEHIILVWYPCSSLI